MKRKSFTLGVTFYITPEMNEKINQESDALKISKSEYIRKSIEFYQNDSPKTNSIKEHNNHE